MLRDRECKISFTTIHAKISSSSSRSECGLSLADKIMCKKTTAQLLSYIQKLERQRICLT